MEKITEKIKIKENENKTRQKVGVSVKWQAQGQSGGSIQGENPRTLPLCAFGFCVNNITK